MHTYMINRFAYCKCFFVWNHSYSSYDLHDSSS